MNIKKQDKILIIGILLLAVVALGVVWLVHPSGNVVEVTIDGQEYGTYSLDENQTISIETEYGSNTLVIQDGKADMTDADCKDQICVKESPLEDDTPRTIVCLPHKLIVEIKQGR